MQPGGKAGAHAGAIDLSPCNQSALPSFHDCLGDEVAVDLVRSGQIQDRPHRCGDGVASMENDFFGGQRRLVKLQNGWDFAVSSKSRRHGHIQLDRIGVREPFNAERRKMRINSLRCARAIVRPKRPKYELPLRAQWILPQPVEAPVFADPVSCADVVGVCAARKSCINRLRACEIPLLPFDDFKEPIAIRFSKGLHRYSGLLNIYAANEEFWKRISSRGHHACSIMSEPRELQSTCIIASDGEFGSFSGVA